MEKCKRCGTDTYDLIDRHCLTCSIWLQVEANARELFEQQEQKEPSPYDGDYYDGDTPFEE